MQWSVCCLKRTTAVCEGAVCWQGASWVHHLPDGSQTPSHRLHFATSFLYRDCQPATSAPHLDMLTFMGRMNTLKIHQQIAKLSLTVSIDRVALYSLVRLSVRLSPWWHLHLSPPCDVLDHTNHIFSETLSSGDDIDRDEDLQKDKYKD